MTMPGVGPLDRKYAPLPKIKGVHGVSMRLADSPEFRCPMVHRFEGQPTLCHSDSHREPTYDHPTRRLQLRTDSPYD
jgi:hypothetical protein